MMDSDSNSNERFYKDEEEDDDDDSDLDIPFDSEHSNLSKRRHKPHQWSPANTYKLIDLWKRECQELWDPKNPTYRDRVKRLEKQEYLAGYFETTPEEINRKLHNLRSQYNNELRKLKKKRMSGVGCSEDCGGWEYFEALSFLVPISSSSSSNVIAGAGAVNTDPLEFNVALAEFQAKEEEQFKIGIREPSPAVVKRMRVATSAPMPLPPPATNPVLWPEEAIPTIRPSANTHFDDIQVFGDFVASELRSLKCEETRKKLKRIIQKAILQVGEDEDMMIMSGHRYDISK